MPTPANLTPEQTAQLAALIQRGDKIGAVKQCRAFAGLGLKEARDAVEELEAKLRAESPEKFAALPSSQEQSQPGPRQKRSGCLGSSAVLLAVVIGGLGWVCFTIFASPPTSLPATSVASSPLSSASSGGWLEVKDVENGQLPFRDGKAHGSWTQELPAASAGKNGEPAKLSGLHVGTVLNASMKDGVVTGSVSVVDFDGYIDLGPPDGPEKLAPVTKATETVFRIENPGESWTRIKIGETGALSVRRRGE
ncbi:MAG: hypothetical protein LBK99_22065 [Opitutaceae bacterium]|jgi:hypothetical protein|nr:hypothetical protein [Opitutaceae bacterium]